MEAHTLTLSRLFRPVTAVLTAVTVIVSTIATGSAQTATATSSSGTTIYWADMINQRISESPADNPAAAKLDFVDGVASNALASDGTYLYWSPVEGAGIGKISRAPIDDPSNVDNDFLTVGDSDSAVYSIAIAGGNIYWTQVEQADDDEREGDIRTAPLADPTNIQTVVSNVLASSVAVDSGTLYWFNESETTIGKVSLSDFADKDSDWFDTEVPLMFGMAIHNGYIYWPDMANNAIGRVSTSDTNVKDPIFISDASDTTMYMGLAADDSSIYWTALTGEGDDPIGQIFSAKLSDPGTSRQSVIEYPGISIGLAVTNSDPGPDPKPTPQVKQKQTMRKGAVPKRIKKRGTTVINKRNATTKQGRPMKAKVRVTRGRGEVKCMTVKYGAKRKVTIRTYGQCSFRVRVTYTAPGNAKYYKFAKTKSYRVKR